MHIRRHPRQAIALYAASLLAACASYHPAPLPTRSQALAPDDLAGLSVDAQKITRPFLAAQAIDLSAPLTPNALAVIAVLENPDLKALRAHLAVADAQVFAASLLPDPAVQGGFDKLLSGTDPLNGFNSQLALDLSQLRTRRVQRQSGDATMRQVRLDLAWAEWLTAGQARLQGVRVSALEQQLPLFAASAASAQKLFDAASRASAHGDLAAGELDARRQGLLDALEKLRKAQIDLASTSVDLNALLGLAPHTVLRFAPPGPAPAPPTADILAGQAVERRLDLQALRAGYDVAEADLHKAVLDQFPNLTLSLAYARDTAGNTTVSPGVGFALPLWNRNRGGIAVAKATRGQLRAEYASRLFQTRAEIATAVAGIATLRRQQADVETHMPELERYAAANARAVQRGDLASATAETSQQSLRDRQIAWLQLGQQIAEQTIALELLSGGPSESWSK